MPAILPGQPSAGRDQPALVLAGGPPSPAPMWPDGCREAMALFRDGTWRLCRVIDQRRQSPAWRLLLVWGVSGRIYSAWYEHDPAKVLRTGRQLPALAPQASRDSVCTELPLS